MNSYGDPQSARARARVPGPSAASTPDDDPSGYDERQAPDAYRRPPGGRASVGGAVPRGAAPVGGPAGRASVGAGTSGRASVGAGTGPVGSARVGGRAVVGAAAPPVAPPGRAAVARAAVRPAPSDGGGIDLDDSPSGSNRKGGGNKIVTKAAKKRRRTNILTAAAAVLVILLGAGVVGGTYFFDDVKLPEPKTEDQSNVITATNGTVLAKVGDQNRTVVPAPRINMVVQHAVAAAEDKNFYDHNGIDMKGIARAAWNNFTGGDTQGASTITQQYARYAADLKDISYNRKLREAVIARKLEDEYDKNQIMGFYLNSIYLGEGRYGIEAAAQGYFGKSVMTDPKDPKAVTPYEAAVIASIIKQPEPTKTHKGYDPNYNLEAAKDRWEYTMKNMLEKKWITLEEYAARKYPKAKPVSSGKCKTCAEDKPVGMIMRHVSAELRTLGISEADEQRGGLTITTTINPEVQKAAEEAGSAKSKESPMHGLSKKYQAAVIGIDPTNGEVLGYYGGDNPNGIDYGGYMTGSGKIDGGQSPGSTFKIYTLAAGMRENISFKTTWDGTKRRANGTKISNAGAEEGAVCSGKIEYCDLKTATVKSYNFPFYWIADGIGPEKVVQAAKDAGLRHMYTDDGKLIDLDSSSPESWKKNFDREVAFGQYRVVPLEHANGVATIVNGGVYHPAHFIKSVKRVDQKTGKLVNWKSAKETSKEVFDKDRMADLDGVLQLIPEHAGNSLRNGREAVAKSGTWEFNEGSGDCWFVGGIPQLAATVWVGGKGNKVELKEENGKNMFGSGTPAAIWEKFLNTVTAQLDLKQKDFPARVETGDPNSPLANGKEPPPPPPPPVNNNPTTPTNPICEAAPQFCPGNNDPGGGNNSPGGGNNDDGNNSPGGGNNDGGNNDGGGQENATPGGGLPDGGAATGG